MNLGFIPGCRRAPVLSGLVLALILTQIACKDDPPPAAAAPSAPPQPVLTAERPLPPAPEPEVEKKIETVGPFMIVSIPHADVFRGGKLLGTTPHAFVMTKGEGPVALELRAADHEPQAIVLEEKGPFRHQVELEPIGGRRVERKIRRRKRDEDVDLSEMRKAVAKVFKSRRGAFNRCYTLALQRNSFASGKVVVQFTVDKSGGVVETTVPNNETHDPELATCVMDKVRDFVFPEPPSATATFAYPLVLRKPKT